MAKDRPNVLVVITHDTGRHIGPYGVGTVRTPAMDRLAAEGVRFANAFCTAPQCSPSRAALFTGRYPHANGVLGLVHSTFAWALHPSERPIATLLAPQGYECVLTGLQHATRDPAVLGFERIETERDCLLASRLAADFLASRASGRPFYLQVGYFETHRHFTRPEITPYVERGITVPAYLPDTPRVREELAGLQGSINRADEGLSIVLEAVDRLGLAENTLVVYTTDHGIAFPRAKCTLYDPGIGVALTMRWPAGGLSGGRVIEDLVSHVDVLPTLLEAAQAPAPSNLHGRSLLTRLRGGAGPAREEIFAEKTFHTGYNPMRAVRTARHKFIRNFEAAHAVEIPSDIQRGGTFAEMAASLAYGAPYAELYDLQADPLEQTNLAGRPETADIERDLNRRLLDWMEATGDPLLHGPIPSPFYIESMRRLRGLQ